MDSVFAARPRSKLLGLFHFVIPAVRSRTLENSNKTGRRENSDSKNQVAATGFQGVVVVITDWKLEESKFNCALLMIETTEVASWFSGRLRHETPN